MAAGQQPLKAQGLVSGAPSVARVRSCLAGGKDHFAADRAFASAAMVEFPDLALAVRAGRRFLCRAVEWLARAAGVSQFVELGCGFPSEPTTYQVARRLRPDARVVYADHDPVVVAHGRALLATHPATAMVAAEVTDPASILADPEVRRVIDAGRPVGVLAVGVLDHLPDTADAARVISGLGDTVAPGSFLTLAQVVARETVWAGKFTQFAEAAGVVWRAGTPAQAAAVVRGWEPVPPGLTDVDRWRPDGLQPRRGRRSPTPPGAWLPETLRLPIRQEATGRLWSFGGVLTTPHPAQTVPISDDSEAVRR